MSSKKLRFFQELRTEVEALRFDDDKTLDALRRRAEMVIRNTFGESTKYLKDLEKINFYPSIWMSGMTKEDYRPSWQSGHAKFINLLDTIIEELLLFKSENDEVGQHEPSSLNEAALDFEAIFIVHGHDEEMKQATARFLEKLRLEAVILHEQPNKGRTIIEKFMDYASVVAFALVLLSPDDVAFSRADDANKARPRARQNVVFELGFFLGKLGRSRVVVIHRNVDDFEMPTDYSGVLFIPYDSRGTWQFDVARELLVAGYGVEMNKLA